MKSKSPKRKQNKTAQKKKSIINFLIKPLIKLTLLVLVIWGSGYCVSALWKSGIKWLDGTSWGRLQEVRITGLERLSESDIFAVVKLDSGCSLMYFPFDSVAALISAIPAIKKARVLRRLPGLLKIDISERHPIAVLCNDGLRFIDGECQVFNPKPSGEVIDLPLITGLT
ncbi:FtsQ-type POTRA domain-containing protein, partial [bacterium]|nr:FtsQ-type POTRA domain-containing protein [bacterium]